MLVGVPDRNRAMARELCRACTHQVETGDDGPAGGRTLETRQDVRERRLARAARTAEEIGVVEAVAGLLDEAAAPAVVDPVMVAKGGHSLLPRKAVDAVRTLMVPRAALVTPNAPEAEVLTGIEVTDLDGQRRAAEALLELGAAAALVKGGHVEGETLIDVLMTPSGETLLEGPRIDTTSTHGTGCTLASASAAGIAQGLPLEAAVARAWAYVAEAIRRAPGYGKGHGPLNHAWPLED